LNISKEKSTGKHKFELLYAQDVLDRRIKELGRTISRDYADKDPVIIGVLKGCVVFLADLIRNISIPIEMEFILASSYAEGHTSNNHVSTYGGAEIPLTNRHILIVEGVVDSGQTVVAIIDHLKKQNPASIEIATLLDKPSCRTVDVDVKYVGFDAGENFVIGFGLDDSQRYRNLPFIGKVVNN
jgi:hypoxanthine phosphoribosyltransferase